jgi:ATP-dependent exoDNAse (exonuclease V) beta subunit
LVQARQITTVKEVSELIDLLRAADQPVPSGDYALTSMQLIARRFGVSEDELTEALRQADPQWDGDWASLKRWQLLWLETQAYAMAQSQS